MLILNRNKGQKIIINDDISIVVKHMGATVEKVSLRITAPDTYVVKKIKNIYTIGKLITVEILDINEHGQAVIGVTAPKTMPVHREEIHLDNQYHRYNDFYNPQLDKIGHPSL